MKSTTLTRQELYDLVWSTPMTTLAKKYGVSDAKLRKICTEMDVPLPKAGHWEKMRAGKEVEIKELSKDYSGKNEVTLEIPEVSESGSPLLKLTHEIESDPKLSLIVPSKLNNPDKLIALGKEKLTKQKASSFGNDSGLVRDFKIGIHVSPINVDRALRFMDTFIKLIKARGHTIAEGFHQPEVIINGSKLPIRIREKMNRAMISNDRGYKNAVDSPSGSLSFKVGERSYDSKEWKDGKLLIENHLAEILAYLELKAKEMKEQELRYEKSRIERAEKEKIEYEIKRRKEKELADFKILLQKAQRWQEVRCIREYLDELEKKDPSKEVIDWVAWARKKADWFDPTIEAEDELLKHVNRNNISFQNKPDPFFSYSFKNYY